MCCISFLAEQINCYERKTIVNSWLGTNLFLNSNTHESDLTALFPDFEFDE